MTSGSRRVLEALEVFFNNETVKIDAGDCHIDATDKIVEVTCVFSDLPPVLVLNAEVQTSLASEHLLTDTQQLRIKKRWKCTSDKPKEEVFVCAHHPRATNYQDLLELTQAKLRSRMSELGVSEVGVNRNSNPAMRSAIWQHCPDLQLGLVEIPVSKEDTKRIWDKLSPHLPLYALFQSDRASRDSDAEVQNPMKLAISTALSAPEIQEKLADVVTAVRVKAEELANRTHASLKKIDENLASELTPEFKADPKWNTLFSLSLDSDDGIPMNKRGSGVRRMILVSFFRAEAERRLSAGEARNIIYAIEEPETSQHPKNQKILLDSFHDLANEPGCQVLLSTHSPGFASYLPVEGFRFIRKEADGTRIVEESGEAMVKTVATTLGVVPDNRVRVLVCVEGPTDVIALKCLSRILHQHDATIPDLETDPRIAFVVLGGGGLKYWVNDHYLRGLGRPEVHIYDRDVPEYATACGTVNARGDGSWGVLTDKREIENYLHPDAISEGLGLTVAVGDNDDLPAVIQSINGWKPTTVKKKLAAHAFPKMSLTRVQARDPSNEVAGWLRKIASTCPS